MSHRTLPVLFINLGGEMIYIIDARLKAQAVEKERSNKVPSSVLLLAISKFGLLSGHE